MSDISMLGKNAGTATGPLALQADKLIQSTKSQSNALENARIEKSAKDFESILLGSWLQGAEKSFASLPGGDDEDNDDPGKDQFQGIAMQSLGASMTAAGGIGIAKMISKQLHKAEDAVTAKTQPAKPG